MPKKFKRDILINLNRYQEKMLYPFYVSCLFVLCGFVSLSYVFVNYHPFFQNGSNSQMLFNSSVSAFQSVVIILGMLFLLSFFAMIYWAYYVSNKMLGPYERILEELNANASRRKKKHITVRDGDNLFADLLPYINALVDEASEAKNPTVEKPGRKRKKSPDFYKEN